MKKYDIEEKLLEILDRAEMYGEFDKMNIKFGVMELCREVRRDKIMGKDVNEDIKPDKSISLEPHYTEEKEEEGERGLFTGLIMFGIILGVMFTLICDAIIK